METLSLHTSDGHVLAADIADADAPGGLRGAVVLCHPHPLYGGNRFNAVVQALFDALPAAGFTALRFDFRAAHDGGVAERLDVVAALDALSATDAAVPRFVVGYSFGALVALATTDPRVAGIVAIAAPLGSEAAAPAVPTLVLTPANDQFCPPGRAIPIVAEWPAAAIEVIDGADHFLHGRTAAVAERTVRWLTDRTTA